MSSTAYRDQLEMGGGGGEEKPRWISEKPVEWIDGSDDHRLCAAGIYLHIS